MYVARETRYVDVGGIHRLIISTSYLDPVPPPQKMEDKNKDNMKRKKEKHDRLPTVCITCTVEKCNEC